MEKKLKKNGFDAELFYAGDVKNSLQQRQIRRLADEGCNMLVIGAVDCIALSDSINYAKSKGVTIISYDRLIMNNPNHDYYTTFDNHMVGSFREVYS